MLRARCRHCLQSISILYPFIELLTLLSIGALYLLIPAIFWFPYTFFFATLIVSIRTDLEHMLISRMMTLYLVPIGFILSFFELLPITPFESALGAIIGFGFLYSINHLFYALTNKQGIGEGDFDLLAYIGSFTGIIGCWMALTIASLLGAIIGSLYLIITNQERATRIPFGPFLAISAIIFVLFQEQIITLLFF